MSKITIIGLQNFLQPDDDLFKNLSVPTDIDKDTLINNIMLKGADFEVLYPEPYFMQNMIGVWAKKWERTFTKWVEALAVEYNPLENYDRIEEWEDTTNSKSVGSSNKSNTGTVGIVDNNTTNSSGSVTNTVSAFDSSSFENDNKSDNIGNTTSNGSNTRTDNLNEVINSNNNNDSKGVHHGRLHGNIGVTTSQQMLQSELDIAEWNIYEKITDMFIVEFCIAVY